MKRNVLIVLILLSTFDLYSQISEGNILISLDGGFRQVNTESGVTTNQLTSQERYLNLGPSVGYFITDRIVAGVGLDYYRDREVRTNNLLINYEYLQKERINLKSKGFLPGIYVAHYYPINNKLFFSTSVKISYGKIKTASYSIVAAAHYDNNDGSVLTPTSPAMNEHITESYDNDIFSGKISPEVAYFPVRSFGITLGLGGIEYALADWEANNWIINFNPSFWCLGLNWKF